jgi:hypothetical protein
MVKGEKIYTHEKKIKEEKNTDSKKNPWNWHHFLAKF